MPQLVSAIIPTYNRAALLRLALRSVAAQTYRPLEAVVVDDGSTDDTATVLQEQQRELESAGVGLLVHHQRNGRAPRARNVAMKLAGGEQFAFLDSDDLWKPRFVERLAGLLEHHPSAALAFSGIEVIDEQGRPWKVRETGLEGEPAEGLLPRPLERILWHMPLQTSGVMVRRSAIEAVGDFDLELPVVEDWDLWYRIAHRFDFAYTLELLACNRNHPDNLPKYDSTALNSGILMNLKHLVRVRDHPTREMMQARIRHQLVLLQEQLLREGHEANGAAALLDHPIAPGGGRFQLGRMMREAPRWAGRMYGRLIRAVGNLRRSLA